MQTGNETSLKSGSECLVTRVSADLMMLSFGRLQVWSAILLMQGYVTIHNDGIMGFVPAGELNQALVSRGQVRVWPRETNQACPD